MIVTSPLFEAYLECKTKCWLRARAEPGTGNVGRQHLSDRMMLSRWPRWLRSRAKCH